jgi:hypothetical protein
MSKDDVSAQPDVSAAASMLGRIGAHSKWAQCDDRTAATAPARAALEQRFLDEAGGNPARAANLRKAYYLRLARASVAARRARKVGRGAA